MKQVSNNIVAVLVVIFIVVFTLQVSFHFTNKTMPTAKAYSSQGEVYFCVEQDAFMVPDVIGQQTAYVGEPYYYDVNYSSNDSKMNFYDNTFLFTIDNVTGEISFTPTVDQVGVEIVNIYIIGSCNVVKDYEEVLFDIKRRNRAPTLDPIPDFEMNQSDHFNYTVTANDPDNDTLTFGDTAAIFNIDSSTGNIYFIPNQGDVGTHTPIIWVKDPYDLLDWQYVTFTIYDINDCPTIDSSIGAQTAIINETYFYDVNATDVDVIPEWNSLTYGDNSTFFDINSSTGIISFFVNASYNGTYAINMSVSDGNCSTWEVVSFSVVPLNHPPNITSWYPLEHSIEINEGESRLFWITKEDPDGTTPTVQWYLDGATLGGQTLDSYTLYSNYNSAGTYNVTVIVSDGLLTDYHNWTLTIKDVPVAPPPSGGGYTPPTSAPPVCIEDWRCTEWSTCPVYELQTRECHDENKCGTAFNKPNELNTCEYVEEPGCDDGVQNCHHGSCEILVDCGGPCNPCPTCSDRIQNCHRLSDGTEICEEGMDCGGPCPACEIVISAKCGDNICDKDEIFSCFQDCGFFMGEYLVVIIALSLASILLYKGWYLMVFAYRKKRKPVYTEPQFIAISTLRKLHLIQLETGKKPVKRISNEFAKIMREYFAKAFNIKRKFTYIEINEIVRRKKLDKEVIGMITDFSIRISEIEYGREEIPVTLLILTVKDAIRIVEKLSGIHMHDALSEKAEKELKKKMPHEEGKEKIVLMPKETEKKVEKKKIKFTQEDLKKFDKLRGLISNVEDAMKRKDIKEASRIYSEIRFIYDKIPDEKKEELYEETVKIIKLYNQIMKSLAEGE